MARVFISHAGVDRSLADDVFSWIADDGHELFYDNDLGVSFAVGEAWEQRLFERLRWADAVVCLVTSAFLKSMWCTAELTTAMNRGSRVLPVLAEAGVRHPMLTGIQFSDYSADPTSARASLAEALHRLDSAGGTGWVDGRNPFPGLRAFDTDMHRVFFGRGSEVESLAELVRSPAERADGGVLMVTGASGCGKSSLVRAGLLPVIAREPGWWTLPAVLPGVDPILALARVMTAEAKRLELTWNFPQVWSSLSRVGPIELVEELLLATPGKAPVQRLLLVIDQFEELITLTSVAERVRFARVLRAIINGPATVVATLRPEFLAPVLAIPELNELRPRSFLLRPLSRDALPDVIRRPAELAKIGIDPELVTRLVTDTGTGEALPLLAFALQELATGVTHGGNLSLPRYVQFGGVRGAMAKQSDAALRDAMAATGRTQEQIIAGLIRLVTVDEQGIPTRSRVPLDVLPEVVRVELDAFTIRRLLTTGTESGVVVTGVAHEAFISAWPPLAEAINSSAAALRARRAVDHAAAAWDAAGRPRSRLWGGGQLVGAQNDLNTTVSTDRSAATVASIPRESWQRWIPRRRASRSMMVEISPLAHDFLRASIRTARRRRLRAVTILSVLLIAALSAAVVAYTSQQATRQQQLIATAQLLLARGDVLRTADPLAAARLALAAQRLHPDGQTEAFLMNSVVGSHLSSSLVAHTNAVEAVAYSLDGRTLATGGDDRMVILWDVTDQAQARLIGRPMVQESRVRSLAFSPDGRTLAVGSLSPEVVLWDVTDPTKPTPIVHPMPATDAVWSVAYSPDGRTLAGGLYDKTVMLWDVSDPATLTPIGQPLANHTSPVGTVAFSSDGRTLATGSYDNTVILWDVSDPARAHPIGQPLTAHTGAVRSVAFSSDGRTLATGSNDNTVILWDVSDPARAHPISQPLTGQVSVAFSSDGRTLATGGGETVTLWDVSDPTRPTPNGRPLVGHTSGVNAVAFGPDGRTVASSGGRDKTVILWNVDDPTLPNAISDPWMGPGDSRVSKVAFRPDGRTLVIGSSSYDKATNSLHDTRVILLDVTDPTHPTTIGSPLPGNHRVVAISPNGRILATSSDELTVILWDVSDPTKPTPIGEPLAGHTDTVLEAAFSPDGRTLATGSYDETVILWDLHDPNQPTQSRMETTPDTFGIRDVAFSPDSRILAAVSSSLDGSSALLLWEVSSPAHPQPIGQPLTGSGWSSVAFGPDGRELVAGTTDGLVLWDMTDPGRPVQTQVRRPVNVETMALSPDGRTLVTDSGPQTVILWAVAGRTQAEPIGEPLTGHTARAVAFSPDGRTIAIGSDDAIVTLWDITGMIYLRDNLQTRICAITGRGLSTDEWDQFVPGLPYQDTCAA